ncbi:MAG: 50S ribosome-binding GTPase [Planctomycetes bacterium]|nr:50S ribosome-binding GTPase [Planctomycetota bacterium]
MDYETTNVAVSSPSGRSSHALIRATGPRAWVGLRTLGIEPRPRKFVRAKLPLPSGALPVFIGAFPANASFSGQDTIEIQLTNNKTLVREALKLLIACTGGRHAEAGEFTARAYLHGNISISAAEGVCATISANNDAELAGAALLRSGALARATEPISRELIRILSLVEAGIDFTEEEDVVAIQDKELRDIISDCIHQIDVIADGKIAMKTLSSLPVVVIAGNPNAGKSTLFNALLGAQRVVVSSEEGTTRDAITERVLFLDKEAELVDIAGFDQTQNKLNDAMQKTAHRKIREADLVLWCVAPDEEVPKESVNRFIVHTKKEYTNAHKDAISALTGEGIPLLQEQIASLLESSLLPREDALALLPRHEISLQNTRDSLVKSHSHICVPELLASTLRDALNSIGAITGHVTPDEIIGEVFSSFCIGK